MLTLVVTTLAILVPTLLHRWEHTGVSLTFSRSSGRAGCGRWCCR
jgi:hypothetical protein